MKKTAYTKTHYMGTLQHLQVASLTPN